MYITNSSFGWLFEKMLEAENYAEERSLKGECTYDVSSKYGGVVPADAGIAYAGAGGGLACHSGRL